MQIKLFTFISTTKQLEISPRAYSSPYNSKSESGNVLIYILGAIFLLGLLTIVVKGSDSPGAGIDQETLMIRVSEVQAYGKELEQAVSYILAGGHSEVDIRFAHPDAASAYGDIIDDPTRQIFSRDGGGAKFRAPPSDIQTTTTPWIFNGENVVNGLGTTGTADSNVDLVALLMNVTQDFCISINEKNSIENPAGVPAQDQNAVSINPFTGNYTRANHIVDAGGIYFNGKSEGCFQGGGTPAVGTYHYYRVLLAR